MYKQFLIEGEISLNPFKDGLFKLDDDVTIVAVLEKGSVQRFTIKAGFITDMGSIPRIVRRWFPYIGNQYLAACYLLHDCIYATNGHLHDFSQVFADELLYEMLQKLPTGVSQWKAWCIYSAVDWFGDGPWSTYDEYDKQAIKNKELVTSWRDK